MGSLSLPIIDFSKENLKQAGSSTWIQKQTEVRVALEEFGCFHAHFDTVPVEAHKKMYGALEDLFNLPKQTKMKNVDKECGMFSYNEFFPNITEATGINDADALENIRSFTDLMWPEGNSSFCETMNSYIQGMVKLEQIVKRMVFESFGLEKYYDSYIESARYLFTGHIYRPQVDKSETDCMPEHTDKSVLTILHQNGVNGLQLETKDGQWVTLTPSPTSFTVMVGDLLMAWSNGRLHCPNHRVVLNGTDIRYSVVLFAFTKDMVEVPKELVDEEHPLLFKPFHYLDLIRLGYSYETGKGSSVRDHYGV